MKREVQIINLSYEPRGDKFFLYGRDLGVFLAADEQTGEFRSVNHTLKPIDGALAPLSFVPKDGDPQEDVSRAVEEAARLHTREGGFPFQFQFTASGIDPSSAIYRGSVRTSEGFGGKEDQLQIELTIERMP